MDKIDRKKFLDAIRQVESSGGKDLTHEPIKYGPLKGETAIGEYGLMPSTVKEFLNRRKLRSSFGPDENIMSKMSDEELSNLLNNQDRIEQNLAQDVADRVLTRSKEDPIKAAYMWNRGHNIPLERVTDSALEKTDYDDKFKMYSDELAKEDKENKFKKLKEMVKNFNLKRQIASEPEGE